MVVYSDPKSRKRQATTFPESTTHESDDEIAATLWPGRPLNRLRKGIVAGNGVTSSPVLVEIAYLARDWGEVGQVFRVPRERTSKGQHSVEVVYGWTSLPRKRCSAQELLQLTRDHWGVENRLHWRRDVTDGGKIAVGSASRL
jgi:hypothetical protein